MPTTTGARRRYAGATYGKRVQRLRPRLPADGGALDVGAGDGAFLEVLQAFGFAEIAGIEPPQAALCSSSATTAKGCILGALDRARLGAPALTVPVGNIAAVGWKRWPELPESFVDQAPETDARFSFVTGGSNNCFVRASQQRTFAFFERHAPGRHSLHIVPGYGISTSSSVSAPRGTGFR